MISNGNDNVGFKGYYIISTYGNLIPVIPSSESAKLIESYKMFYINIENIVIDKKAIEASKTPVKDFIKEVSDRLKLAARALRYGREDFD